MRKALAHFLICSIAWIVAVTVARAQPASPVQTGPKNLTVLPKNWTGSQVLALMQTFNESLGVQCSYCHAADPKAPAPAAGRPPTLDYASDLKDEKENARRMIRMVMALNADSLKGLGDQFVVEKVTCYTCHRGTETPARIPPDGWTRGGFSLLPSGPPAPARGGTVPPAEHKKP